MEDSDNLYGMTGSSIASIFRDQAQIQQINRRIAAQKQAKEDADAAKTEKRIGQAVQAGWKATSAINTKQNRIARSVAADNDLLEEDVSSWNPFKGGKKRLKFSNKFKEMSPGDQQKALIKMKHEDPDQYDALANNKKLEKFGLKGRVDMESAATIKGGKFNLETSSGGSGSISNRSVDLTTGKSTVNTSNAFADNNKGNSLFDRRNQALATPGSHPSTMYQNKIETTAAGNVPGTSYTSADFERGARKEIMASERFDFTTDEDLSGSISRAARRNAREASETGIYLSSPEGKQDAAATGLNSYASLTRDIGSLNFVDSFRPSEPVDDGMDEWSDPMEPAPDPNAMPEGGTLKEFKSDNPEVNVQADQYSKFRDQGISDQAAKDQIARDQLESDPDYQKVMGSEDNYEGVREIAPYMPTEEDVLMDQMINEKMGLEDALPKGEVVPEDVGMAEFQEQGKITNAAQDAGYGNNINAYRQDIKAMETEGFEGTIDEYNKQLEIKQTASIGNDVADAAGTVESTAKGVEDASILAEDSVNLMDSVGSVSSTGGTLANLADSAGLINLKDETKQGIEAAQTIKKTTDTVNAVKAGTVTAASGMGKIMPAVGVVSGAMAAFDKSADKDDRVRGGLTAIGSAMMLTPMAPVGALLTVGSSLWSLLD